MGDCITIKPNHRRLYLHFLLLAAVVGSVALLSGPLPNAQDDRTMFFGTCLALLVIFWIFGTGILSEFRTICLAREGVTISFLGIRRFYPWSDFTIHYESYRDPLIVHLNGFDCRAGAVVISRRSFRFQKPKNWQPEVYGQFFHPFRYVFLHFPEDEISKEFLPAPYLYSREEFVERMSAFGVLPQTFYEELKQIPKQ